ATPLAGCDKADEGGKAADTATGEKTDTKEAKAEPPKGTPGDRNYPSSPTSKPVPSLLQACKAGNLDAVRSLLDGGADPNAAMDDGLAPLHYATGTGQVEIAKLLIEKGANVDCRQALGGTPLHIAAAEGKQDLAVLLLDAKADINA